MGRNIWEGVGHAGDVVNDSTQYVQYGLRELNMRGKWQSERVI